MAWSKFGWYRLFLPEYLPSAIDRVLYLDCDVCVTDKLDELFDIDMEDRAIAGAMDPESYSSSVYDRLGIVPKKGYVCSGVLMLNLDYWRQHNIAEQVLDYGKKYPEKTLFPDQDAINVICQDAKVILSPKYSPFLRIAKFFNKEEWNEYISHPAIIHYAGCAPWKGNPNNHPFHYYWWEAFNAMPFNFWNVRYGFWKCQMKFLIKNCCIVYKIYSRKNEKRKKLNGRISPHIINVFHCLVSFMWQRIRAFQRGNSKWGR